MLNLDRAIELEYTLNAGAERVEVTTASGVEYALTIAVARLEALGQQRLNFPILCYTLPMGARIDGILGLDFLRRHKLTIDFRIGLVTLE
jgi:hypothetical protein